MKTKLTVGIDQDVAPEAKRYARMRGVIIERDRASFAREVSADGTPAFSQRWRGQFRPAARKDNRYRQLARKYL